MCRIRVGSGDRSLKRSHINPLLSSTILLFPESLHSMSQSTRPQYAELWPRLFHLSTCMPDQEQQVLPNDPISTITDGPLCSLIT